MPPVSGKRKFAVLSRAASRFDAGWSDLAALSGPALALAPLGKVWTEPGPEATPFVSIGLSAVII